MGYWEDVKNRIWLYQAERILVPPGALIPDSAGVLTKVVDLRMQECFRLVCTDLTTVIGAATNIFRFEVPYASYLVAAYGYLQTPASTGTFTVDVNKGAGGTSILSTKMTFDATEPSTRTAATPLVISDPILPAGQILSIDVDNAGAGDGKGLAITLVVIKN